MKRKQIYDNLRKQIEDITRLSDYQSAEITILKNEIDKLSKMLIEMAKELRDANKKLRELE